MPDNDISNFVKNHFKDEIIFKQDICPDNYVGNLKIINGTIEKNNLWFCKHLRKINDDKIKKFNEKNDKKKIIAILLESPNIDEFDSKKCSIAPAPALGATGCNLDNYFLDLLNDKIEESTIEDGQYNVILLNAIQYQCSLGQDTKIYRDEVWLNLWINKNYDMNFVKRLKQYSPDIVINCCTNGDHRNAKHDLKGCKTVINKRFLDIIGVKYPKNKTIRLKQLVQNAINYYIDNFNKKTMILLEGKHPSSWQRSKDNRKINFIEKIKPKD